MLQERSGRVCTMPDHLSATNMPKTLVRALSNPAGIFCAAMYSTLGGTSTALVLAKHQRDDMLPCWSHAAILSRATNRGMSRLQ